MAGIIQQEDIRVKVLGRDYHYPCAIRLERHSPVDRLQDGVYVVYGLFDPRNRTLFYVGQTHQFFKRMRQHCVIDPFGKNPSPLDVMKYDIHQAGLATHVVILEFAASETEALAVE